MTYLEFIKSIIKMGCKGIKTSDGKFLNIESWGKNLRLIGVENNEMKDCEITLVFK